MAKVKSRKKQKKLVKITKKHHHDTNAISETSFIDITKLNSNPYTDRTKTFSYKIYHSSQYFDQKLPNFKDVVKDVVLTDNNEKKK
jgi:hypothetical protein